jgi:cell fate regulator YaaT (PSP1 superfamily)
MERFHSVTVRMAKRQNLSLNPSKISGMCGRLMCCLAHEVDQYPDSPRDRG